MKNDRRKKVQLIACDKDSSAGYSKTVRFHGKDDFFAAYQEFETEVRFSRWYLDVDGDDDVAAEIERWLEDTDQKEGNMDNQTYTLCQHCDHFVDENDGSASGYLHLEDGEQEFDHDAEPGETKTKQEWKKARPDLYQQHSDGKIGPNSFYHSRRGKVDPVPELLYLSFEQEAVVATGPDAPEGANPNKLDTGYVTVADGNLYDGPGAKAPPGNVLAFIGPIHDKHADEARRQVAALLTRLGHKVLKSGVDY